MATEQGFYFKLTDIHNIVNRESAYALDSNEGEEGQSLTDKSIFGEDEADFFKRLLRIAGGQVYKRIHRYGKGVTDPYQFDVEYESNPGYIIYTLILPDNFDLNLTSSIDSQILETLVNNVLAGWFSKQRRNYLAEEFQKKYDDNLDELKSILEMRTLVRRPSVFWDRYYTEDTTS
jgi:hypothetical protein